MGSQTSKPTSGPTDPVGSKDTHQSGHTPLSLAGVLDLSKLLKTFPEANNILQRCSELLQRLQSANTGISHLTDAQYNLVQSFFSKKFKLVDEHWQPIATVPNKKGKSAKKQSGKSSGQSNDVEIGQDDLNKFEQSSLASMQNGILHHASDIDHAVKELQTSLKSVIPEIHAYMTTHPPVKQIFKHTGDNGGCQQQLASCNRGVTPMNNRETLDSNPSVQVDEDTSVGPVSGTDSKQSEHEASITHLKSLIDELQSDNTRLREKIDVLENQTRLDEVRMKDNLNELKEQISEQETTISENTILYENLQVKYDNTLKDLADLKKNNEFLEAKNRENQMLVEKQTSYDELAETMISEHEKEKQKLLDATEELERQLTAVKEQESHFKTENVKNVKQLEQQISEIETFKKKYDGSLAIIQQKETQLSELEKIKQDLYSEQRRLQSDLSSLEKERRQYKQDLSNAIDQNSRLKQKLETTLSQLTKEKDKLKQIQEDIQAEKERQMRRKKVSTLLYVPRRGDLLNAVVGELRAKLTSQFGGQSCDVTFTEVDSSSQIVPNAPVLVVCINASRLGTDVSNALSGVQVNSQTAVIILHHKEIHALPNQSSERVLTSVEYKALGGIFDMACLSSRGLYPCDMNSNAIIGLVDFIKQLNSQTAVIILHHKEIHALPNQSSERVLTSVEYKALGGIFDMACLSSRGLYPCDMNSNAIIGLVDFIKQRS